MKLADLEQVRVAVWGLGNEGEAAVRALRARFPAKEIVVLDEGVDTSLPASLAADQPVRLERGKVTVDRLREYEVIIRSPGISIYRDEIVAAKQVGVLFTSGTNLWFAEHPGARTLCVTGSKGKSTTTHLTWHLLNQLGVRAVKAGNIGVALLSLPPGGADTVYVMELSSYQLSDFEGAPTVAVLLNLYPEHLDWHRGEANYFRDKTRLLARAQQARVINGQDPRLLACAADLEKVVRYDVDTGFHHDDAAVYRQGEVWVTRDDLHILGGHNLSNLCAALTAVAACGIPLDKEHVRAALRDFRGLDHRLTKLGERDGVLYVDDSIATIPQATAVALRVFSQRAVTVLVGGHDRGLDQRSFAATLLREKPSAVVTLPGTGAVLARELRARLAGQTGATAPLVYEAASLAEAVAFARSVTPADGVVLLSPGAPSYNTHKNFVERGKDFARLAGLPPAPEHPEVSPGRT